MANKESDNKLAEDALNIVNSLQEFSVCRTISISELDKDLKSLKNDYKRLQSLASDKTTKDNIRLQTQVESIGVALIQLEELVNTAKASFNNMAVYFGESSSSTTTEVLFGVLDDFLVDLAKAKKKHNAAVQAASSNSGTTGSAIKRPRK